MQFFKAASSSIALNFTKIALRCRCFHISGWVLPCLLWSAATKNFLWKIALTILRDLQQQLPVLIVSYFCKLSILHVRWGPSDTCAIRGNAYWLSYTGKKCLAVVVFKTPRHGHSLIFPISLKSHGQLKRRLIITCFS